MSEDGRERAGGPPHGGERQGEVRDDREHELVEQQGDPRRRRAGDEQFGVAPATEDPEEEAGDGDPEEPQDAPQERDRTHERDGTPEEEPTERKREREEEPARGEHPADPVAETGQSPAAPLAAPPVAFGFAVGLPVEVVPDDLAVEVLEEFVRSTHTRRWSRGYIGLSRGSRRRVEGRPPRGRAMTDDSLDGRRFRPVDGESEGGDGEVDAETTFEYHEEDGLVWARYSGGSIRLGFLVGVRRGDSLSARYAQVMTDGTTANGHTESRVEVLDDGRLRLHEDWSWDSREGSGESVVEEIRGGGPRA